MALAFTSSMNAAAVTSGVNPELDFTDGFEVVPQFPDIVVINPGVNASELTPGQSFNISATVSNQGDAVAATTILRYYRSDDDTITTTDTELGSNVIPALAAAGQSAQDLDSTAPPVDGTYWTGACVEPVPGESDTDNQCSLAVEITVTTPTAPDLIVINPGVSKANLEPNEAFTFDATAKNQGDAASAASTLRYYLSTDAVVDTSDTELGSDAIPALSPATDSTQDLQTTAPGGAGDYWLGGCVEVVAGESDPANQCSASVQISVAVFIDSDGDRLPDSAETNTGIYLGPTNTGTDPNNNDTDGDSIKDGDEVLGPCAPVDSVLRIMKNTT